jgi:hypothetical protein
MDNLSSSSRGARLSNGTSPRPVICDGTPYWPAGKIAVLTPGKGRRQLPDADGCRPVQPANRKK